MSAGSGSQQWWWWWPIDGSLVIVVNSHIKPTPTRLCNFLLMNSNSNKNEVIPKLDNEALHCAVSKLPARPLMPSPNVVVYSPTTNQMDDTRVKQYAIIRVSQHQLTRLGAMTGVITYFYYQLCWCGDGDSNGAAAWSKPNLIQNCDEFIVRTNQAHPVIG